MPYQVFTTDGFDRQAKRLSKKHKSIKADLAALVASLADDPQQGTPLGKECYKIRMAIASKRKGKSGGARVVALVKVVGEFVLLLAIYDKSEKETLDDGELDSMLRHTGLDPESSQQPQ